MKVGKGRRRVLKPPSRPVPQATMERWLLQLAMEEREITRKAEEVEVTKAELEMLSIRFRALKDWVDEETKKEQER